MSKSKNIIICLFLSFLMLSIFIGGFIDNTKNWTELYKNQENIYNKCKGATVSIPSCEYVLNNYSIKDNMTADTFTIFFTSILDPNVFWLNYVLVIIFAFPTILNICKLFSSRYILNVVNRSSYKKVVKGLVFNSLKKVWIILVPICILFLLSYFYSGHFNYNYLTYASLNYSFYNNTNVFVFLLAYIVSLGLFFVFLTNIGIIVSRKNHNIVVVVIESFLLFLAIDIFIELGVGVIMSKLLINSFSSRFNLVNILNIGYAQNVFELLFVPSILVVVSYFAIYALYRNKEKLLIDCEKNS